MTEFSKAELGRVLLADLKAGYTLQQTVDDLCACTGLPAVILDLNNRILLHAQCQTAGRIWDFAFERGCLPNGVTRALQSDGGKLLEMYKTGKGTVLEPGEIDDCCHACVPLCAASGPAGFLAVHFSQREEAPLAAVMAEKLSELYRYFSGTGAAETAYQGDFLKTYLARELLLYDGEGGGVFQEMYPLRADGRGGSDSRFRPGFCIAALRTLAADAGEELRAAENALPALIPRSVCLISGQLLWVMFFGLEEDALKDGDRAGLLTRMDLFTRRYRLYCGLSSVFRDLSLRRGYKHQARDALRLGTRANPAGYLFRADELYTQIILSEAVKRAGGQILTLSDVAFLAEYDAKNKTSYLHTLEQYLRSNNRIAAAAKAAFIDRGTMKYRLEKISALLQTDFDHPEVARLLRLGIAVYAAAERERKN